MTSSAYDTVLQHPRSNAARRALLEEWRRANDSQWRLIDLQLRDNDSAEAAELIRRNKRAWSRGVNDLAPSYYFDRGLVSTVGVGGDVLTTNAQALFTRAPIQHIELAPPIDIKRVLELPWFGQLTSLTVHGSNLGDSLAQVLATSPATKTLHALNLCNNNISSAGIRALHDSPHLQDVAWICLDDNPGAHNYSHASGRLTVVNIAGSRLSLVGPEWLSQANSTRPRELGEEAATQSPFPIYLWPPNPTVLAADK